MFLSGQGILTPGGTRDFGSLKSGEEVLTISHGHEAECEVQTLKDLVLSRQHFTSIGLEFSRGTSTVCHPDLLLLSSIPFEIGRAHV